jgi:hypothetical protein
VKGQSNSVIAGSPRNAFRCSVGRSAMEVEHWMGKGAYKLTNPNQTPNAMVLELGSESTGDELRGQKGNSPDRRLRPLIPN